MSTHNKYINRKKIVTRPRNRMGGENFKKATIATITIIIAAMIITSGAWLSNGHLAPSGGSPQVIATLVGNVSNPHPYYNTTNGYVSPNLWGLQYGGGNTTMYVYSNNSIHTIANFTNVGQKGVVLAYSSVHYTYDIPMSLQTALSSNLSSFVSFNVVSNSQQFSDVAYDLFLGQDGVQQAEIMIFLFDSQPFTGTSITVPMEVSGQTLNTIWQFSYSTSASGTFNDYEFIPTFYANTSGTYVVNISAFLLFLETKGLISPSISVLKIGIGSEYGDTYSTFNSLYNSFWMQTYLLLNGTKYQVVQPSGGS